ncbi:transcriptional regulator%2C y4mF family [uncultured Clostridium sp.]|nr:transcriptional regulator%2C y4mF family [uncultured Clostridium sp.]
MDCAKIGRLIAHLRKEKGLTQQDIADALGITNKTVSKWECGVSHS